MNPDRNRSGWTINVLMQIGCMLSAAIPVVLIALLGVLPLSESNAAVEQFYNFRVGGHSCAIVCCLAC